MKRTVLAVTALAGLAIGSPAAAAQLLTYTFAAQTTSGPTSSHSGTFTLKGDGGVWSLHDIDFSIGSTVFTLANAGLTLRDFPQELDQYDTWLLGGKGNDPEGMAANTDDFWLITTGSLQDPSQWNVFEFGYTQRGFHDFAFARGSAVTMTAVQSAVPEPATWALLIAGFGMVGGAMRVAPRRKLKGRTALTT